ncbi:MAG: hypothetical protein SVR08_11755 [Spirochaetota bacterium]|nr:hypothetical protein [Spirochaetota bacterium]
MISAGNDILRILFLLLFSAVLLMEFCYCIGFAEELEETNIKQEILSGKENSEVDREISDLLPRKRECVSMVNAIVIDLILPGGGHFYTGKYYYGTGFALLKVIGGCLLYHYYDQWKEKRSDYYSSKTGDKINGNNPRILQNNGSNGSELIQKEKLDYDRSAQNLTFTVIANAALYLSSLFLTYSSVKKINESSIPTFEFSYSSNRLYAKREEIVSFTFNFRI